MGLFNHFVKVKIASDIANSKSNPSFEKEYAELTRELSEQDNQLESILDAEEKYKDDIDSLIAFWESVWKKGGLKFNGSQWTFRLPDLYIKQKRYDDALKILGKINNPIYAEKKKSYIDKINAKKAKTAK